MTNKEAPRTIGPSDAQELGVMKDWAGRDRSYNFNGQAVLVPRPVRRLRSYFPRVWLPGIKLREAEVRAVRQARRGAGR